MAGINLLRRLQEFRPNLQFKLILIFFFNETRTQDEIDVHSYISEDVVVRLENGTRPGTGSISHDYELLYFAFKW